MSSMIPCDLEDIMITGGGRITDLMLTSMIPCDIEDIFITRGGQITDMIHDQYDTM